MKRLNGHKSLFSNCGCFTFTFSGPSRLCGSTLKWKQSVARTRVRRVRDVACSVSHKQTQSKVFYFQNVDALFLNDHLFMVTQDLIRTLLEHLSLFQEPKSVHMHVQYLHVHIMHCSASLVEFPLRGTWGHGFDPQPRHTKVFKNGTSCSSLSTQTYGEEPGLVETVSG